MAGTIVANTLNTDTGLFSTQNAYQGIAKAWVNFQGGNGSTAGVINGSFNVSSITVNSSSNYIVNIATALSSSGYAVVTGQSFNSTSNGGYTNAMVGGAQTTTTFYLFNVNTATGGNATAYNVFAACFGA